eukprot:2594146-Alexandrium_andersonii.AAC.1
MNGDEDMSEGVLKLFQAKGMFSDWEVSDFEKGAREGPRINRPRKMITELMQYRSVRSSAAG